MIFRNFSIKVVENLDSHRVSEDMSYPVIAVETVLAGMNQNQKITDPENTYVLIGNDDYKMRWVPLSDCEFVDLT